MSLTPPVYRCVEAPCRRVYSELVKEWEQFLFVNGRDECIRMVKKLLLSDVLDEKHDLQLAYDLKLL